MLHSRAARGESAGHPLHQGLLRLVPGQQQLTKGRRHRRARRRMGEQLLDEEGDPVTALEEPTGFVRCRHGAQDVVSLGTDLARGEAAEVDPGDAPVAVEIGEEPAERVTAPDVVAAVGHDDQQRRPTQHARRDPQNVERRGVGPVQVLDDHDDGPLGAQALEHVRHHLVEAVDGRAGGPGGVRTVDQVAQCAGTRSCGVEHRVHAEGVRQPADQPRDRHVGSPTVPNSTH